MLYSKYIFLILIVFIGHTIKIYINGHLCTVHICKMYKGKLKYKQIFFIVIIELRREY